jgi:hypothetical protein
MTKRLRSLGRSYLPSERNELSNQKNIVLTFITKIVLKFIWDCKQRYCLPNLLHCKMTITTELTSVSSINKKFKAIYNESGYNNIVI